VVYRLADEAERDIVLLLGALQHVAEHAVASMERIVTTYFRARDQLEPVAAKELLTRLRRGDVVILDVRPEDEYGLGHLPRALNIPLCQLEQRIAELPRDQALTAFSRLKPSPSFVGAASKFGVWNTVSQSGRPRVYRSRWQPDGPDSNHGASRSTFPADGGRNLANSAICISREIRAAGR